MIRNATVSKFYYRLTLGRTDGRIIPLGVVALLKDDAAARSFLVLLARSKLEASERNEMDWAASRLLASPLEFLKREIDRALAERVAGDVVHRLSQKFTWSIYASPPAEVAVPEEIAADLGKAAEILAANAEESTRHGVTAKVLKGHRARGTAGAKMPRALAHIAGPEFEHASVSAYTPPAWMFAARDNGVVPA